MSLPIYEIAVLTKEYVRNHIKNGITQLETNDYPDIVWFAIVSGVLDVRNEFNANVKLHTAEESFEIIIETIKKYSLGNCGEIAYMALYYVITHHPQVYAQIYSIGNGNHVFLIIGRKKPLLPMCLETWDKEAFVCDAWSDTVYPVTEWKEKLKDYKQKAVFLSKAAQREQRTKYKYLEKNVTKLEKPNYKTGFFKSKVYDKIGNEIGETYFFNARGKNYTIPLNNNHYITPLEGYDSISQYRDGALYRRDKIKSVIFLLQPFKVIFPDIQCFYQLLHERHLLRDYSINKELGSTEFLRRKKLINQSIDILKKFTLYLQNLGAECELKKRVAISIPEQCREIDNAIACLNQLLEKRALQDINHFNTISFRDEQFSQIAKVILKEYQSPTSNKMEKVEKMITMADKEDINTFISYFYKVLKPTLQEKRNPILNKVRNFFSPPVNVKSAKVIEQLAELINNYSYQLTKLKRLDEIVARHPENLSNDFTK